MYAHKENQVKPNCTIIDLLCLSRHAGIWSIFHYVLSSSLHFSWLIYWCHKWLFVSLQFAPMEMTPEHMHVASNSSLFTSYIIQELSELYPNVPICLFSQS